MRYEVEVEQRLCQGTTLPWTYETDQLEYRHGGVLLTCYRWREHNNDSGVANGSVFLPYGRVIRILTGAVSETVDSPHE